MNHGVRADSAVFLTNPCRPSYPEEIAALLVRGELAIVEKLDTGGQDLRIAPVREQPSWLIDRLIALYASLSSIEAAYLGAIGPADRPDQQGLLVAAAVPNRDAERVARATTATSFLCGAVAESSACRSRRFWPLIRWPTYAPFFDGKARA